MSDGRPRKPQHLRPSRAPYSYPDEAAPQYPERSGPDRSPRNGNDPERILAPARAPEPAPGRGNSPGPVPVRGRLPEPGAGPGAAPGPVPVRGRLPEPGAGPGAAPGPVPVRGRLPEPGAGPGAAPGPVPLRGRLPGPGAAPEPVSGRAREPGRRRAQRSARRRPRRGRWLAVGLVAVLGGVAAAAAAVGVFSSNGPAHVLMTPAKLGAYVRRPQLEQQVGAKQLQREVTAKSAGQARHVIYAVYEDSAGGADGKTPQIMLFIGGNLSGTLAGRLHLQFHQPVQGRCADKRGLARRGSGVRQRAGQRSRQRGPVYLGGQRHLRCGRLTRDERFRNWRR